MPQRLLKVQSEVSYNSPNKAHFKKFVQSITIFAALMQISDQDIFNEMTYFINTGNLTLIIFEQNGNNCRQKFYVQWKTMTHPVAYQIPVLFIVFELFLSQCKLDPALLHIFSVINVSNFSPTFLTWELKLPFSQSPGS